MNPTDLHYSKEHEWARDGGDGTVTFGITAYAQEQLGDVVFVDLPKQGATLQQFAKLGEIESVKAVSDLFSPLAGEVIAINPKLKDAPELVNKDPYGDGWMLKIKMKDPAQLKTLMSAHAYDAFLKDAH